MRLVDLKIGRWQQFRNIDMYFDEQVTFITGVNTTGKTSICKLLSALFTNAQDFLSILDIDNDSRTVGTVSYNNEDGEYIDVQLRKVKIPNNENFYRISGKGISPHHYGIYIKSNRIEYKYVDIKSVSSPDDITDIMYDSMHADDDEYKRIYKKKKAINFLSLMKSTLLTWAIYGYGNKVIEPNHIFRRNFEDFQEILKLVLPKEVGFEEIVIVGNDVLCKIKRGRFPIDSSSSGIANVIEICWKCYISLQGSDNGENIVIIDEPENHLHPSLQQSLIPDLLVAFPKSQFIIATHSPLIISSVRESAIYGLAFDSSHVVCRRIENSENILDSEDVLRDILGISSSMPRWAHEKYQSIILKYRDIDINSNTMDSLEKDLTENGLEDYNLTGLNEVLRYRNEKIKNTNT